MPYFNFSRLIQKYNRPFKMRTQAKGHYDDSGEWVNEKTAEIELYGAIISYKESKIFGAEGTLTAKDKHLFMQEPIQSALKGTTVIYEGEKYNVEEDKTGNATFTGVYAYTLKYVSAFDDKAVTEDDRQ